MIQLADLQVMQADLRYHEELTKMSAFVKEGGFWTKTALEEYAQREKIRISPLIQISVFEDGQYYVHDGHHRGVSTCLGGRDYLRDDEYEITEWRYALYLERGNKAHKNGWFTPFDPRTHVRLADFASFKKEVKLKYEQSSPAALSRWIESNRHRYCEPRNTYVKSIVDLAEIISKGVKCV